VATGSADLNVKALAQTITSELESCLGKQGTAFLGLSGGSSLDGLFPHFVDLWPKILVEHVQMFLADERLSANPDEKNLVQLRKKFLAPLEKKHSVKAKIFVPDSAQAFPFPRIDLLMLGVGHDGHIASLFPGTPQLQAKNVEYLLIENSPKPPPRRLTLSGAAIRASSKNFLFFIGEGKETAFKRFLAAKETPLELPAELCRKSGGIAVHSLKLEDGLKTTQF
jgi:6-phosphogluconolactonase